MDRCRRCSVELVAGENCDPSRLKKHDYICRPCMRDYYAQKAQEKKTAVVLFSAVDTSQPASPKKRQRRKPIADSMATSLASLQAERDALKAVLQPIEDARDTAIAAIEQRRQEALDRAKREKAEVDSRYFAQSGEAHDRIDRLDTMIAFMSTGVAVPSLRIIQDTAEAYLKGNPDAPESATARFIGDHIAHLVGAQPGGPFASRVIAALRAAPHRFHLDTEAQKFSVVQSETSEVHHEVCHVNS